MREFIITTHLREFKFYNSHLGHILVFFILYFYTYTDTFTYDGLFGISKGKFGIQ